MADLPPHRPPRPHGAGGFWGSYLGWGITLAVIAAYWLASGLGFFHWVSPYVFFPLLALALGVFWLVRWRR